MSEEDTPGGVLRRDLRRDLMGDLRRDLMGDLGLDLWGDLGLDVGLFNRSSFSTWRSFALGHFTELENLKIMYNELVKKNKFYFMVEATSIRYVNKFWIIT